MTHLLPEVHDAPRAGRLVRSAVSLRQLFPRSSFVGCAGIHVSDATDRSGDCRPGELFAVIRGNRVDGARFVGEAIERGAAALLVERPIAEVGLPQCVVPDVRRAYAELVASLAGSPSRKLALAGVTGTNGKTTVTWLVRSILRVAERQTGLLGTIEYDDGVRIGASSLTTPDPRTLSGWLARMVASRTTHAALEVSSHALHQGRLAGTQLDVAVVTNITQDHLDYHQSFDEYKSSKTRILGHCKTDGLVVLNADDPHVAELRSRIDGRLEITTYGLDASADISATIVAETVAGCRFVLFQDGDSIEISSPLVGKHNVSNCLAAAAVAARFGVPLDAVRRGIETFPGVPGRLERIDGGQRFDVFVDYAHTDDALRRSIRTLRGLARGRVLCVFGAGGDRDKSKRPLLGQAAAEADLAIVTSDNPRTEDPQQIIDQILKGFPTTGEEPCEIVDRAEAIREAVRLARPGDCVLIAGKGHESEQIIGTGRIPFDDRLVVREALQARQENRSAQQPVRVGA
ncbi:MAG: UDP-N-acetylmuramoyl-L-alanyl-D-glutamate--2,6-diaminopimelate ligase [Planctomycetaceae bacterium]